MGMTFNQLALVQAVAENNISKAKKAALACCAEDNTQKNKDKVNRYTHILKSGSMNMMELPANINRFASMEELSFTYNENRYYLSENEKELFILIRDMHSVSLQLMEKQIPYLNATLLYGESGVGKTAFARFVAYKLGIPYMYVNLSQMMDSYLGGTAKNLTYLFSYINQKQCVVMLDEIDSLAVGRKYADGSAGAEVSRSTTCLLQLLDAVTNDHIIIAATNLPDSIDGAVKRRFTQHHEIKRLSSDGNYKFIKQFMDDAGFLFDETTAREYAKQNLSQAQIMTHMTRQIAAMLINKQEKVIL